MGWTGDLMAEDESSARNAVSWQAITVALSIVGIGWLVLNAVNTHIDRLGDQVAGLQTQVSSAKVTADIEEKAIERLDGDITDIVARLTGLERWRERKEQQDADEEKRLHKEQLNLKDQKIKQLKIARKLDGEHAAHEAAALTEAFKKQAVK